MQKSQCNKLSLNIRYKRLYLGLSSNKILFLIIIIDNSISTVINMYRYKHDLDLLAYWSLTIHSPKVCGLKALHAKFSSTYVLINLSRVHSLRNLLLDMTEREGRKSISECFAFSDINFWLIKYSTF